MLDIYTLIQSTLRLVKDTTLHLPPWLARNMYKPRDAMRRNLPGARGARRV